jgi:hypothetical protein
MRQARILCGELRSYELDDELDEPDDDELEENEDELLLLEEDDDDDAHVCKHWNEDDVLLRSCASGKKSSQPVDAWTSDDSDQPSDQMPWRMNQSLLVGRENKQCADQPVAPRAKLSHSIFERRVLPGILCFWRTVRPKLHR